MKALPRLAAILAALAALGSAAGAAGQDPDDPDVVLLNEFVVATTHADWQYVSYPGYEVISRCRPADTEWFARGVFRSLALQDEIVPEGWLHPSAVPFTAILYDHRPEGSRADGLIPHPVKIHTDRRWEALGRNMTDVGGAAGVSDPDTLGVCANLWGPKWPGYGSDGNFIVTDGGILAYRLARHAPPLPPWLRFGLEKPFGLASFLPSPLGVMLPPSEWVSPEQARRDLAAAGFAALAAGEDAARNAPAGVIPMRPYVVKAGTRALLLPLSEIFRDRRPGETRFTPLYQVESALFVKWIYTLSVEHPKVAAGFERFVARAERAPVTEAVFQDCFGEGYGDAEARLAAYLDRARAGATIHPYRRMRGWPTDLPATPLRPATRAEVSRIIGDWERMRAVELRATRPELSVRYFDRAGELLHQAYAAGARDPRLLAVLGLYESDLRHLGPARKFLEAAVAARVIRPEAYFRLALIRYEDAVQKPAAPGQKFSAEQLRDILRPIFSARRQDPLPPVIYSVMAAVWSHAAVRPTAGNLAIFGEGLDLYPHDFDLAYKAAALSAQWHYPSQEDNFIARGLIFADASAASRLRRLQSSINYAALPEDAEIPDEKP